MDSFQYYSPRNIKEAIDMLNLCDENTYLLAGGTDLIVKLRKKIIQPNNLISLKKIKELSYIEEKDNIIKIGAMATHSKIEQSEIINGKAKILAEACRDVGSTQIRNLGTIGGNIMNSSAAADSVAALCALDANCVIKGSKEERIVNINDVFGNNGNAVIYKDELLKEIFFRIPNSNTVSGFKKLGRRSALAIVVVSVGIILERIPGESKCKDIKISLGGISRNPCRAKAAETILIGKEINNENIEKCLDEISKFTVNNLEKSPFTNLIPHKRYAVKGIALDVFERICPELK
ncbi:FAD binding domain-containing protein [Clostridium magnum]|uniref:Nicotinate dehydrogenase FAD-subunit n=1 Tax=Clostridium magnum DSM 2767 TaxID=1121326 RepID=A0A161WH79_9CLOT|nr:FAD binding domain-containing protein [Clostridium magnum]KZL91035.1 nicotinate dehydrogenase FAD-subunit [Clostridium magnum DSM 2767]SHI64563.1 carbon-monoxide dehydrogenase medium subunit [Clostridium magnum DSM 2767]